LPKREKRKERESNIETRKGKMSNERERERVIESKKCIQDNENFLRENF
jgi:hypothetical protein